MPKGKFIDKKKAYKFTVVHRSQRDNLKYEENQTDFVLKPILEPDQEFPKHLNLDPTLIDHEEYDRSDFTNKHLDQQYEEEEFEDGEELDEEDLGDEDDDQEEEEEEHEEKATQAGIHKPVRYSVPHRDRNLLFDRWSGLTEEESMRMDHDYDYNKHLRPLGKGFFQPSTEPIAVHDLYKNESKIIDESDLDAKYGGKVLPSFDPEELAREVVQPTFHVTKDFYKILDKDEVEVEELEDDFIVKAMQDGGDDDGEYEDYDDDDLFGDDDDVADFDMLPKKASTKEKIKTSSAAASSSANDDLEKKLAEAMLEYEEDEVSDLEDDPETMGTDDISAYQEIMDEQFSKLKKSQTTNEMYEESGSDEEIDSEDEDESRFKKFEAQVTIDTSANELTKKQFKQLVQEEEEHADEIEEKLHKELDAMKLREEDDRFDCQSIISTYSNTENHPKMIAKPNKSKVIKLGKSGLPVGIQFPGAKNKIETIAEESSEESDSEAVNKGVPRKKGETKEEKKARKKAQKEESRMRKEEKKATKLSFKHEIANQKSLQAKQQNNIQCIKL